MYIYLGQYSQLCLALKSDIADLKARAALGQRLYEDHKETKKYIYAEISVCVKMT